MIPHLSGHHICHPSCLKPLLPNAPVTILLDGLIYTAYNEKERLYQAGIHTDAEKHHLIVEVRSDGELLFPSEEFPWDSSLQGIRDSAPFWLYVDSGNGRPVADFSAELHKPNDLRDPRSFGHILAFERLYNRSLKLDSGRLAEFNFPGGTCYSAKNSGADLLQFEQGSNPDEAQPVGRMTVSTLSAVDIAGSGNNMERWIVLENDVKEFFRFPLHPRRHYEIKLMNVPAAGSHIHDPASHFLQFYELFELDRNEKVYLVKPDVAADMMEGHADSPPCITVKRELNRGLSS